MKTNVERTLETLVEFADVHRQSLQGLTASIDRLTETVDKLAIQVGQNNQGVREMRNAIDGHLKVAEQQSANISELTKLVAIQAQTVSTLVAR